MFVSTQLRCKIRANYSDGEQCSNLFFRRRRGRLFYRAATRATLIRNSPRKLVQKNCPLLSERAQEALPLRWRRRKDVCVYSITMHNSCQLTHSAANRIKKPFRPFPCSRSIVCWV